MITKLKCVFSLILTAAILLASLTACDSEKPKAESGSSKPTASNITLSNADPLQGEGKNGQIKLKVWAPDAAVSLCIKQCKKFSEDMKSYGDIKISVVPQGEANSATTALTDAESAADVYGFACDNLDKLVQAGVLLKVTGDNKKFVESTNSEGSVLAATYEDVETGNKSLYAYPETGDNSYCLVYDKTVVSDEDAKTFEGVLSACKAANKHFVFHARDGYYACMFLFTGGLRIDGYENDGYFTQKFNDYNEDEVIDSMMAFRTLLYKYKDTFVNGDVTKICDGFKSGTVGAGFDGSWNFKSDKETLGDRAKFTVLPTININGESKPIINMFGYKLLGVNAFTKYPATANELAKYLSGEECQRERAEELNWGPSNKVVAESDIVKNDDAISAILAQAENSVPQVHISATFWAPLKTCGNKLVDFENKLTEDDCKELLHTTIANIRDE